MSRTGLHSEIIMPRRPVRANGQKRYAQLVSTVEDILKIDGLDALSIQLIAERSGVPKASVYHFFPHTSSACIAVAEKYFDALGHTISKPEPNLQKLDWRIYVKRMMFRAINFYNKNDFARQLILGSNYSWQVRQADLENNKIMANTLFSTICDQFDIKPTKTLKDAIVVSISIGEAVWAVSVAEHGSITKKYENESYIAVCGYFAHYFDA